MQVAEHVACTEINWLVKLLKLKVISSAIFTAKFKLKG